MIKTSCKEYSEIRKKELKEEILKFKREPCLVVFQIDENPASNAYIRGKKKDCSELGIKCVHVQYSSLGLSQEKFERLLTEFGRSDDIHGMMIQLPIPKTYDLQKLLTCIPKEKDVDGFRQDSVFQSCTPKGIMDWLAYNQVNVLGKEVCVVGRSEIVGKPLVNLLIDAGATVICCNSHTKELAYYTQEADIVVSAIGKAKYFNSNYFNFSKSQLIIDVGINRDRNGCLCGDIDRIDVLAYCRDSYVTPVPGGVGLLTRNALIENVVAAYKLQNGE